MSVDVLAVAPVAVPRRGPAQEFGAVSVVWRREMIRFWLDKTRIAASSVQPLLFLLVLGGGLAATIDRGGATGGIDYKTFLFPGVITTGVMFSAVFSAISIVWDREVGFLREMLVAPVSRSSIVVGKCLGGATVAAAQGIVLLPLAGLVHVPYQPRMLLGLVGMVFVISFAMTAFGLVLAVRVKQVQTVMPMVQLLLTPLMFLSGSLFPPGGALPTWLVVLTRVNPLSYGVDAARRLVLRYVPGSGGGALRAGITWNGWLVPTWLEVLVVAGLGAGLLAVACALFGRTE